MATSLPRYENMGAQFADLPRVSTASQDVGMQQQQVRMQQFDQVGRALDRMTAYFQDAAVTQAEKEGRKYAIENPLTKEQVDIAREYKFELRVPGGGAAFQRAYQDTQAQLLSSELQLEGQRKMSDIAARIKAGENVDPDVMRVQLRDMVDGYASTMLALDPKESIRLRSALTIAGNQVYKEANDRRIKVEQEQLDARLNQAVTASAPLVETIIKQAGAIDPRTGKEVDIEALLDVQRKPLYDSIRVTGSSKHVDAFNKIVVEAKVGALTSVATSPDFATSAGAAMAKVAKGDFGSLSTVYKNLTESDKALVRDRTLKAYSDAESARKIDEANIKLVNREKGNTLSIEMLNPKTTAARRREIVTTLISLNEMTFEQAEAALKPKSREPNPQLEVSLYQQIRNGQITNIGQLSTYAGSLSNSQYEQLGRSIVDIQYRSGVDAIRLAAGITDNMINPAQEKITQLEGYMRNYQRILSTQVKNEQGVMVYPDPATAARQAVREYSEDRTVREREDARKAARESVERLFTEKKLTMPNLPLDQIDPSQVRGLSGSDIERLKKQIAIYKSNL
nr:MAG TPA: hypothetical protein [Caudoviricetes sp.]